VTVAKLWSGWLRRAQSKKDERAVQRRPIPDDLWKRTLVRFPFLRRKDDLEASELRRMTSLFLDRKEFTAVGNLRLSDAIAVSIAAQAVLPVLKLGLARYDGFVGVVVHADQVVAHREVTDEDGIVHQYGEVLAGEAVHGGPVMLSWRDVRSAGRSNSGAYNVVIHEFAHVLDMENGLADGIPVLPSDWPVSNWQESLSVNFRQFQLQAETKFMSVIDAYGAESEEEFFAVASEAFFVHPTALQQELPSMYSMLKRLYKQDPAAEQPDRLREA
jgi:Mlc titration factor MtfA (ptsG expression regulator)